MRKMRVKCKECGNVQYLVMPACSEVKEKDLLFVSKQAFIRAYIPICEKCGARYSFEEGAYA